jgi:hypothetical protein
LRTRLNHFTGGNNLFNMGYYHILAKNENNSLISRERYTPNDRLTILEALTASVRERALASPKVGLRRVPLGGTNFDPIAGPKPT